MKMTSGQLESLPQNGVQRESLCWLLKGEIKVTPFPFLDAPISIARDDERGSTFPYPSIWRWLMIANFHPKIPHLPFKDWHLWLCAICHDALSWNWDCLESMACCDCPHLSFADNKEGVSSGPLSDDVLSFLVVCLLEEKKIKVKNIVAIYYLKHENK